MANKKLSQLSVRTPSLTDLMLIADPATGYSYKATVTAVASIIETDIGDAFVTLSTTQTISGAKTFSNTLTLSSVTNASTDTDKFVVLDGGVVKYRTGTQVLSDIGGVASSSVSGTTNYLSKFTSSSAIGDSQIYDNGTTIGVGTTSPLISYKMTINGSLAINGGVLLSDGDSLIFGSSSTLVSGSATNEELYLSAGSTSAGKIIYNIGNSEKMRLTSTGLGIGTSSPAYKLDVSISSGTEAIRWTNSTRSGYTYVDANGVGIFSGSGAGGQGFYLNDASINLSLWTNGSAKMTITSGGNVGIGTSSPSFALDVTTENARIRVAPSTTTNYALFQATNAGNTAYLGLDNSTGGLSGTAYALNFYHNGAYPIVFSTSATERMRITSGGDVGIGTTSPIYPLFVYKAGTFAFGSVYTISAFNDNTGAYKGINLGYDSGSQTGVIYAETASAASNMAFWTYNGSAWGERMRITSGGNVGIGTTSPSRQLEVYSATTDTRIAITNTTSTSGAAKGLELLLAGSDGYVYNYANGALIFGANATERMRITSGGDVGIGTSSPTTYSGYTTLALNNATNGGLIDFMAAGNVLAQIYATTSYLSVGSFTNMPVRFMTNNSERMRITSGGNVLVGTTTDNGNKLQVAGDVTTNSIYPNADNASYNGLSNRRWISVYAVNGTIQTSDYNLKTNIKKSDLGLDYIMQLNPVSYNWKQGDTKTHYGLIAQEIEKTGFNVGLNKDNGTYGLNYSEFIAPLIKAIQELKAEIETLKN